jgi:abequosyltransferase
VGELQMIDILIPTYNRSNFLKKNILLLDKQISEYELSAYYRILVSDNKSEDDTWEVLNSLKGQLELRLELYRQAENIGLEANAIFLLEKAEEKYVMYLGDDDYIPDGYLKFVISVIEKQNASCVIPGISKLWLDGTTEIARDASFGIKRFEPGFSSVLKVSRFGHQLSGVVTQRYSLYEEYVKEPENRNIYPFIFFVSYCALYGITYYAPKFKVLVTDGNTKDWAYDDSGLLTEVFKNYQIVFPRSVWKRFQCCIAFINYQPWRLRVGFNVLNACKALIHISRSSSVDFPVKLVSPVLSVYFYARKSLAKLRSNLHGR